MMMFAADACKQLCACLKRAGVDAPAQQARVVMEYVLHIAPLSLPLFSTRVLTDGECDCLAKIQTRLCAGEPLQYVLGTQAFWDIELQVTPDVLIPRSETEELAFAAVTYLRSLCRPRVLDLCTGSGALALAIKRHVPQAQVTASDISDAALLVAQNNARRLGLDISFLQGDLFAPVQGEFDLIVCNPPYIRSVDCLHLAPTVRRYEPMLALDGGADGLDYYRRIALEAPLYLPADGMLMLEVGFDQAQVVGRLLQQHFHDVVIKRDMQAIARMVWAKKRGFDERDDSGKDGADQKTI
jgi:release factor glutamine methyltransferase